MYNVSNDIRRKIIKKKKEMSKETNREHNYHKQSQTRASLKIKSTKIFCYLFIFMLKMYLFRDSFNQKKQKMSLLKSSQNIVVQPNWIHDLISQPINKTGYKS